MTKSSETTRPLPALPLGWHIAKIEVRRDRGWCFGGPLTYDALLEWGGHYEARGVGSDPVAAVEAAVGEINRDR